MEWQSDSPWHSHTYPGQGCRSPGRCSSWELEFRDSGAVPVRGLLLTAERHIEGMWGRRSWGEMSMEGSRKARKPWKQGDTPESRIGGGAITIACLSPHASICSWKIERVAHQMPHALNYRVGRQPGCSFKYQWAELQSRTPPRCPFKCLMRQSTE